METSPLTNAGAGASSQSPLGSGDPRLDAIKAKQSRAETLTPSERGYLAYKNSLVNGKSKPPAGKNPGAAAVARQIISQPQGTNPLLPGVVAVETPGVVSGGVPVDPALVAKTVRTVLNGVDGCTQRIIASKAKRAGADAAHQAEITKAVALAPELRDTIADTSPDALAAMGVDTSQMPLMAFIGGIAVYAITVANAVASLTELERQKLEMEKERTEKSKVKPDAPANRATN